MSPIKRSMASTEVIREYDAYPIILELLALPPRERREHMRQMPSTLFKYRPLDPSDEKQVARLREIIVSECLWSGHFDEFNDPFDGAFVIKRHPDKRIFEEWLHSHKDLYTGKLSASKKLQIREQIRRRDFSSPTVQAATRRALGASTGIISLSANPRSILMWSHYAANHSGVCIMLDATHDWITVIAQPVVYQDSYPVITVPTMPKEEFHHLRKSLEWKYEEEWRIVTMFPRTSISLRPGTIKGLILGHRCPPQTASVVEDMNKEREKSGLKRLPVYTAYLSDTRYGIGVFRSARAANLWGRADVQRKSRVWPANEQF